jgi:hypothetical protein
VKHVIWIPIALFLTAGLAALVLNQVAGGYHVQDIAYAAGITLVSAELAMIPITLTRKSGPVANFQAAFGGTVIHLFLTFAAGAACYGLKLVADRQVFLFLLLGFYWFSLVFVVIAMIRIFRRSIPHGAGPVGANGA